MSGVMVHMVHCSGRVLSVRRRARVAREVFHRIVCPSTNDLVISDNCLSVDNRFRLSMMLE